MVVGDASPEKRPSPFPTLEPMKSIIVIRPSIFHRSVQPFPPPGEDNEHSTKCDHGTHG